MELGSPSRRLLMFFASVFSLLRVLAFFNYRFDSDEAQHLHVVWTWTAGFLPYRDQFDNHVPFFSWLMSPLLRLVGEREDVLYWMRLPMLILFSTVIVCTWILARRIWSASVAWWAILFLAFYPTFFLRSVEFRTDNLWLAFWMVALVILLEGPVGSARATMGGFVFGLALITSLKTGLLLISLSLATAAVLVATTRPPGLRLLGRRILLFVASMLAPPLMVVAFFFWHGALGQLYFCTIRFNDLSSSTRSGEMILRVLYGVLLIAVFLSLHRHRRQRSASEVRRFFLAAAIGFYLLTLVCLWPVITDRDQLAVLPLVMIFAVALLGASFGAAPRRMIAVGSMLIVAGCAGIALEGHLWSGQPREEIETLREVIHLTKPDEWLMDYKGETVFRRRPYYYVLEFITRAALRAGKLPDTIVADMIRDRCYVTRSQDAFFPQDTRDFIRANFLDIGRLRVAGQAVGSDGTFAILIPGEYAMITPHGLATGVLDGRRCVGPRHLETGRHVFRTDEPVVDAMWARAFERGFSPFMAATLPGKRAVKPIPANHSF